jgi:hypothetical protein
VEKLIESIKALHTEGFGGVANIEEKHWPLAKKSRVEITLEFKKEIPQEEGAER